MPTERLAGDANGIVNHGHHAASLIPTEQLDLETLCRRIHTGITRFLEQDVAGDSRLQRVQEQTRTALGVIDEALDRYSLSELSLSYNGGKDCLVLLVLYLSALYSHSRLTTASTSNSSDTVSSSGSDASVYFAPVQSVYIKSAHPFSAIEDFVSSCEATFSLSLARYTAPMKAAFASYLADRPAVKAIFVGTRRTDPHGGALTHFDETDRGWPKFMRIHPVIDWHYVEIWTFIRYLDIPYCKLYDLGYTSLGGTTDTLPNPALRLSDSDRRFRPAYELVEDAEERLGREKNGTVGGAPLSDQESKSL